MRRMHTPNEGSPLVPATMEDQLPRRLSTSDAPAIIKNCSAAAVFAWQEFFEGQLPNQHTRTAYCRAVHRFAAWCERHRVDLIHISPGLVGRYFAQHPGSIPTKKQHLAALRHFFDRLVLRHVIILNPAASVRAERYHVIEGKTPEIHVDHARKLLESIDVSHVVGRRDRAIIGALIYTAARVGAVAKLTIGDLESDGRHWSLRFEEKGGKARSIPVRHDLEGFLLEYLQAAGHASADKRFPLFRSAIRKTNVLTENCMTPVDICRMVKRRMRAGGLPTTISPHSFRVTTITNLLEQGVPLEDVQYLAGHADPRTTRLYDRRRKKVSRNIVERISI